MKLNKNKLVSLTFIIGLSLFSKVSFSDGGVAGGGGNGHRSSPEQVKGAINSLKSNTLKYFSETGSYLMHPMFIRSRDIEVVQIIGKMVGSKVVKSGVPDTEDAFLSVFGFQNSPLESILKKIHLVTIEKGACTDGGHQSDASTRYSEGSDICFSLERLTRVPPTALKSELIALLLHELSHQFGADEPTARKIQNIFSRRMALTELALVTEEIRQTGHPFGETIKLAALSGKMLGLLNNDLIYGAHFMDGDAGSAQAHYFYANRLLEQFFSKQYLSEITVSDVQNQLEKNWNDNWIYHPTETSDNHDRDGKEAVNKVIIYGCAEMVAHLVLRTWENFELNPTP